VPECRTGRRHGTTDGSEEGWPMTRLSPQVLVQLARRTVERELTWTRTELHAPPIPEYSRHGTA
jgi:hypothetical protein